MEKGVIIVPYLQRRTESEGVNIMSECPLKSDNCLVSLIVNPITADFKKGWLCLHSLTHFNYHKEHSDYLITSQSGDYVEIGLISDYSFGGVLDFNPCSAFGAFVDAEANLFPLVSAVHTSSHSGFQTIGVVVYCMIERPFLLAGGEWAELPTQCQYLLLFFISRFHSRVFLEFIIK